MWPSHVNTHNAVAHVSDNTRKSLINRAMQKCFQLNSYLK